MADPEYEHSELVQAVETKSEGSKREPFKLGDKTFVFIVAALLVAFYYYIRTLPEGMKPNYFVLAVASVVIYILYTRQGAGRDYILTEQEAKAAARYGLRYKQLYSKGELPDGQILVRGDCKERTINHRPHSWAIAVDIRDQDSRVHHYGTEIAAVGPLIGTITWLERFDREFSPSKDKPDVVFIPPDVYATWKAVEEARKKSLWSRANLGRMIPK